MPYCWLCVFLKAGPSKGTKTRFKEGAYSPRGISHHSRAFNWKIGFK
jgi:hypothetical protein